MQQDEVGKGGKTPWGRGRVTTERPEGLKKRRSENRRSLKVPMGQTKESEEKTSLGQLSTFCKKALLKELL